MAKSMLFVGLAVMAVTAAAMADSTFPRAKDRDWKVVYASAEAPDGRALESLTAEMGALMLRDNDYHTFRVLPLEKEGSDPQPFRHRFVLGTWRGSALVRSLLAEGDVPAGGYCVRAFAANGTNTVVIAGERPVDVLYGTFDFIEDGVNALRREIGNGLKYRSQVFDGEPFVREYRSRRAPKVAVRSLFTWGHVIDDYRGFFREMARLKLNRAILWNDFPPVNAAEVVSAAHSWGVEVFWGFAWGWVQDCRILKGSDFDRTTADVVVDSWRRNWRDLPGDGIYFQTFTERAPGVFGGESVASRAVGLVNAIAGRIHAERPSLEIVFGLHATSVRDEMDVIARTDPSLEILWEDCGGFPYSTNIPDDPEKDRAFTFEIAGQGRKYGLAIKCQLLQDWTHWIHQAGPFVLGCAGTSVLTRDRLVAAPLLEDYRVRWISKGDFAYGLFRALQASGNPPHELNTVVEYNPPFDFTTALVAELIWSCDEPYETIRDRVLARTRFKN